MDFQGVRKISEKEAYCKHCDLKIHAVIRSGNIVTVNDEEYEENDLEYRINKHISSNLHRENYFEFMEYNHNLVAYING